MREIKFRGKFLDDTSEWVYGNYFFIERDIFKHKIIDSTGLVLDIKEDTLGQYTGLHDKNGKEIYEGDIADITRTCVYETGKIIEKNGCYFAKAKETLLPLFKCEINEFKLEVIGNIYDNPELLKEE